MNTKGFVTGSYEIHFAGGTSPVTSGSLERLPLTTTVSIFICSKWWPKKLESYRTLMFSYLPVRRLLGILSNFNQFVTPMWLWCTWWNFHFVTCQEGCDMVQISSDGANFGKNCPIQDICDKLPFRLVSRPAVMVVVYTSGYPRSDPIRLIVVS